MIPETVWVKVEVEGEDATMHRISPGDSYNIDWTVTVDLGVPWAPRKLVRHIRISVPQEGVKPLGPPPWETDTEVDPW